MDHGKCACTERTPGCCGKTWIVTDKGLRMVDRKGWFRANGIPELSEATAVRLLQGSKARVKWEGQEEFQTYD